LILIFLLNTIISLLKSFSLITNFKELSPLFLGVTDHSHSVYPSSSIDCFSVQTKLNESNYHIYSEEIEIEQKLVKNKM
jgi:hypothetical protein